MMRAGRRIARREHSPLRGRSGWRGALCLLAVVIPIVLGGCDDSGRASEEDLASVDMGNDDTQTSADTPDTNDVEAQNDTRGADSQSVDQTDQSDQTDTSDATTSSDIDDASNQDTGPMCAPGQSTCGTSCCVDLATDSQNCGACGNVCQAGQTCVAGSCSASCPAGLALCNAICTDLQTDRQNCGGCGDACPPGLVCDGGACELYCVEGFVECPGPTCVEDTNSPDRCAADPCTDTPVSCADGQICDGTGNCASSCATGYTDCDGECVDLESDEDHCGVCGTACDGFGELCRDGACACGVAFGDCNADPGDGCETALRENDQHCGACGNACGLNSRCSEGVCACHRGYADCDGDAGCETLVIADDENCGACGNVCAAGETCCNGACVAQ